MAYGDYNGPDKPNKGQEGGACNRQRCQAEPANWFNHGSRAWYCDDCRNAIEFDEFNYLNWLVNHQPECGHPMFETRQMMDEREARDPLDNGIDISGSISASGASRHDLDRDLYDAVKGFNTFDHRSCLRASNPRVVVCHCASCGGK